jgi:hypothetical protein
MVLARETLTPSIHSYLIKNILHVDPHLLKDCLSRVENSVLLKYFIQGSFQLLCPFIYHHFQIFIEE